MTKREEFERQREIATIRVMFDCCWGDPNVDSVAVKLERASVALENRTGDYPEEIQEALKRIEEYAIAKGEERYARSDEEQYAHNDKVQLFDKIDFETFNRPIDCMGCRKSKYDLFYELIARFELGRLRPDFQDEELNGKIRKAREEYAAAHPLKPKGFWESLFG